ncbi:MAG: CDP-alcohol phosphatidyltransferase family protein [Prevotellaceae bacterium]|jgi:CDP-diacylglycerol--serine O-phosphatidyltransferase|nr:CDP-alcohol phosphatidyltransferase family protein [Prevotellaceae bacterium]
MAYIRIFTLPNLITCLNLLSGCVGIVLALSGFIYPALMCVLLAGMFDFLDGFTARLLRAYSPVGVQLDSLADMVSFGTLPAVMLLYAMKGAMGVSSLAYVDGADLLLLFSPFVLTAFSALRLAKFNVDDRQHISFLGLPTPANALFFAALAVMGGDIGAAATWLFPVLIAAFSFLLVCELPMFSLKVKNFSLRRYALQLIFLLLSAVVVLLCALLCPTPLPMAIAGIIVLYILLSTVRAACFAAAPTVE